MLNHVLMSANFERQLKLFGNKVRYLKFDSTTTKNKYGESKKKSYLPPIEFNAIVKFDPNEKELEEFGMDKDNVEVMVKVLTVQVEYESLTLTTDDVIEINGERFFITSLGSAGRIGDKPIFRALGCKRVSDNRGT